MFLIVFKLSQMGSFYCPQVFKDFSKQRDSVKVHSVTVLALTPLNSSTDPKVDLLLLSARLLLDVLLRLLLCCLELSLVVVCLLLLDVSLGLACLLLMVVTSAVLVSGVDVSLSLLLELLSSHENLDLSDCVSHCLDQDPLDLSEVLSHDAGML